MSLLMRWVKVLQVAISETGKDVKGCYSGKGKGVKGRYYWDEERCNRLQLMRWCYKPQFLRQVKVVLKSLLLGWVKVLRVTITEMD